MSYTVYKHTAPNGKVYIGITSIAVNRRWSNGKNYLGCVCFNRAIQKYGWDNIQHEILFTDLTKEEAEQKETELITFYHSNNPTFGYNIANGGNHCGKHSEETRRKIGMSQIGNKRALGIKRTEETKKKISEAHKGKKHGTEHNKRMGEAHMHPVICVETGITYSSVKMASEKTGINKNCISHACNGRNKSAGSFHWKFARCAE